MVVGSRPTPTPTPFSPGQWYWRVGSTGGPTCYESGRYQLNEEEESGALKVVLSAVEYRMYKIKTVLDTIPLALTGDLR